MLHKPTKILLRAPHLFLLRYNGYLNAKKNAQGCRADWLTITLHSSWQAYIVKWDQAFFVMIKYISLSASISITVFESIVFRWLSSLADSLRCFFNSAKPTFPRWNVAKQHMAYRDVSDFSSSWHDYLQLSDHSDVLIPKFIWYVVVGRDERYQCLTHVDFQTI